MPVVLQPNMKSSDINKNTVAEIAAKLGIVRPLAEVLYTRGYNTVEKAAMHLSGDADDFSEPTLLPGIEDAAQCILDAIRSEKSIVIYGDYDVDGVCSVSILMLTLRVMKAKVSYYIPDRHTEGYGLNADAVQTLAKSHDLLLTVDCGISSYVEVELAKQLGMQVIVTDHHSLPEQLPHCTLVNPKLPGAPFSELCGAGVAFKLAAALLKEPDYYYELLDLVAIATVADVVPLVGENRLLVKRGLARINQMPRPSLLTLIQQSGYTPGKLSATDIAFGIAPRINAAGRLERADMGVKLLIGEGDAMDISIALNALNSRRQSIEEGVLQEAVAMALKSGQVRDRRILVLAGDGWDKGVVGIAASRMVERFHRPCILLSVSDGVATGSGRSVEGVNMFEMLCGISEMLIRFGGHAMAAGLTISVDNLDAAAAALDAYVRENIDERQLFPIAKYDARVCVAELNAKLVTQLDQMAPFGMGNPTPKFRVDGLQASNSRRIGKLGNHLKVGFKDESTSIEGIAFSFANKGLLVNDDFFYTVVGTPTVSQWNNVERVCLRMESVRQERSYENIKNVIFRREEKLFRAFFEQIMYNKDKDIEDAVNLLESTEELLAVIDGLLSEDAFGTLILCSHPAVARAVSEQVFDNHPRCDIDFYHTANDVNGYNTLLIGGQILELSLDGYSNIVVCDGCFESHYDTIAKAAPHAEVYALHRPAEDYIKLCPMKYRDFSRENMGKAYMAIKKTCLGCTLFESRDTFVRNVQMTEYPLTEMVVNVALEIFEQLNFVECSEEHGKFKVVFNLAAGQNPLTNSEIYRNIMKYQEVQS